MIQNINANVNVNITSYDANFTYLPLLFTLNCVFKHILLFVIQLNEERGIILVLYNNTE